MLVLRFVISATVGTKRVYWGGRNNNQESTWFTNIGDAYAVPGRHYMNLMVWNHLPDPVNVVDGERLTYADKPTELKVEDRWVDA